jgi:predicted O-methyltransferase YrrM
MTGRTISMNAQLDSYLTEVGAPEPPILTELRRETAKLPDSNMQIGPAQGGFMRWLVELIGAQRCLEIGVYTGYSSTAVALAMGNAGRLVACDINAVTTEIAKRYWELAGVTPRIQLRLGPAVSTLKELIDSGEEESFDFVFIDADKGSYDTYYELSLTLLRNSGLILIDNTLWSGAVVDPNRVDPDTQAIRALNRKIAKDGRVSACIVPVGDGLSLLRKL